MDVNVENHGSIVLVRPLTAQACQWCDDHIPDDAQWFGKAVVVEPRYVAAIVQGMQNDGLTVGGL